MKKIILFLVFATQFCYANNYDLQKRMDIEYKIRKDITEDFRRLVFFYTTKSVFPEHIKDPIEIEKYRMHMMCYEFLIKLDPRFMLEENKIETVFGNSLYLFDYLYERN